MRMIRSTIYMLSLVLFAANCSAQDSDRKPKLDFDYGENGHILTDGFLFDTGAEISLVTRWDSLDYDEKKALGKAEIADWSEAVALGDIYMIPRLRIANNSYSNTVMLSMDKFGKEVLELLPKGIMGMNIISQYNWDINFREQTLERLNYEQRLDSSGYKLKLNYRNRNYPLVSFKMNGIDLENILLDTGAEYAVSLPQAQLEQLLSTATLIKSENSSFKGLHDRSSATQQTTYYYISRIEINGVVYYGEIDLLEAEQTPRIGINFLKLARRIVLDTQHRVLYMY